MADRPRFIWYELMTSDQDAAEAFYGQVVGWKMADAGQAGMRYTILSAGDRGMGGLLALSAEDCAAPPTSPASAASPSSPIPAARCSSS